MILQKEREITERERQFRLGEVLHRLPIRNEIIWMFIVGDVESRGRGRLLTFDDCVRIVETNAYTHPGENISAAVIAQEAGAGDLSRNRFLNRVSFNFGLRSGVEERWELAQRALMNPDIVDLQDEDTRRWLMRTIHQFQGGPRSIDYGGNTDFMSPDRYFKEVEMRHFDHWNIRSRRVFNRDSQAEEVAFQLTGYRPTRVDNMVALGFYTIPLPAGAFLVAASPGAFEMAVAVSTIFAGWWVTAEIQLRRGGWNHLKLFDEYYEEKVFPLLVEEELVKAADYGVAQPTPTIVRSSL